MTIRSCDAARSAKKGPTGPNDRSMALFSNDDATLRGMITRRLVVRAKDVVFVKGVIEAHDGLAHVFAESGGDLTIAAAAGREAELDDVVNDLAIELDGITPHDDR
jgi:hypothetical protein